MKNNKGITLTSLVIYIAIIFVIIAALMRVTSYFSNNMKDATDVSFETEFNKLNLYFLDESKKSGNIIQEIIDGTTLVFSNGNKYFYNSQEEAIYLNNTIRVCQNVEDCLFEEIVAENGKNILKLTITINSIEKTSNYIMITKKIIKYENLLPNEYQEVEYIQSTGTQYIDPDFLPSDNTKIETMLAIYDNTGVNLMGYDCSGYAGSFFFGLNSNMLTAGYRTKQEALEIEYDSDWHYYCAENGFQQIDELTGNNITSNMKYRDFYIFACNTDYKGIQYAKMKVKYVTIYVNEEIVRNMVPCYRKSDKVVGMYDTINDVFYSNAGTGEFLKGEEKKPTILTENQYFIDEDDYIVGDFVESDFENLYQKVEYIASTGTQYIDPDFLPSDNTKIETMLAIYDNAGVNLMGYDCGGYAGSFFFGLNSNMLTTGYRIKQEVLKIEYDSDWHYYCAENGIQQIDELTGNNIISNMKYRDFYIFACNTDYNGIQYAKMKVKYVIIYENEEIVRNMVPCYRKSDKVVGMYDTVNDVFYTNAGTGTFVKGVDIN